MGQRVTRCCRVARPDSGRPVENGCNTTILDMGKSAVGRIIRHLNNGLAMKLYRGESAVNHRPGKYGLRCTFSKADAR